MTIIRAAIKRGHMKSTLKSTQGYALLVTVLMSAIISLYILNSEMMVANDLHSTLLFRQSLIAWNRSP